MDNIILIGMPAVGKSTVGVIVAKRLGYNFVDTDLVIQEKHVEAENGKTYTRFVKKQCLHCLEPSCASA